MSNSLISYQNSGDDATLTNTGATAVESSLPLTNMQDRRLTKKTRWQSDDSIQFKIDLGSAQDFSIVVLMAHNMTTSATWQIETSTDDFSTVATDTGSINVWPISTTDVDMSFAFYQFSSTQTAQYLRITLSDATNSDGYVEVGRLWVDDPFQPSINPEYGLGIGYVDPSTVERSKGGQPWFNVRKKYREFTFDLRTVGDSAESEMFNNVYELERALGKTGDLFFVLDPSDTSINRYRQSVYGFPAQTSPIVFETFNHFSHPFTIREAL